MSVENDAHQQLYKAVLTMAKDPLGCIAASSIFQTHKAFQSRVPAFQPFHDFSMTKSQAGVRAIFLINVGRVQASGGVTDRGGAGLGLH